MLTLPRNVFTGLALSTILMYTVGGLLVFIRERSHFEMGICANCSQYPEKPWKEDCCFFGVSVNGQCPRAEFSCPHHKGKPIVFEAIIYGTPWTQSYIEAPDVCEVGQKYKVTLEPTE